MLSNNMKIFLLAIVTLLLEISSAKAQMTGEDHKLTGTIIGPQKSVDYATNTASTTVNTRERAFDNDLNTYFAAYDRSFAWVGLDLGEPHVITRIGWAPAHRNRGDERILLGVFEGANTPDFMDALPLYIITQKGTYGKMDYAETTCSKGFRYVRYVVSPVQSSRNRISLINYLSKLCQNIIPVKDTFLHRK